MVPLDGAVQWTDNPHVLDMDFAWAFDIETNARHYTDPDARVTMIGVDDGQHTVVLRDHVAVREMVAKLRWREDEGFTNVGHNAIAFDAPHIEYTLGVALRDVDDTQYLAYALDPSLVRIETDKTSGYSLQAVASRYLEVPMWKDQVTWEWATFDPFTCDDETWERAALYNARDVRYTHRLYSYCMSHLTLAQYRMYAQIMKPTGAIIREMFECGVPVDEAKRQEALADLRLTTLVARAKVLSLAEKHGLAKFNPNSTKQLGVLLHEKLGLPILATTRGGKPSIDKQTVAALRLHHDLPELEALQVYNKKRKLMSILTPNEKKGQTPPVDGRIYPNYSLTGTVSGRLTSYGWLAPQRQPRDPMVRGVICAPPGRKLVIADLSQIEMRTMAFLSREPNMLAVYKENLFGGDMHNATAHRIATLRGATAYDKKDRSLAKPVNFGCLYGAEAFTLRAYLLNVYGIRVTMREAEVLREAFFAQFPGLTAYYGDDRNPGVILQELKANKGVWSPFGRFRRLPKIDNWDQKERAAAFREAINTPNQGTASDLLLLGCIHLKQHFPAVKLCANIHDAVIAECAEDVADEVASAIKESFEEGARYQVLQRFNIDFDVPIKCDVSISQAWA